MSQERVQSGISSYMRDFNRFSPDTSTGSRLHGLLIHAGPMSEDDEDEKSADGQVATARPKLKQPPRYKVILLNDDYTPMEFVVEVLQRFFNMNREKATQIMLTVHTKGKATCGIYVRDVAETKSAQVNQYAKENEHPLVSEIEAVDD